MDKEYVMQETARHPTIENTREERETHLRRATRRSKYFIHTRTGKKYAQREIVQVVAEESRMWAMSRDSLD